MAVGQLLIRAAKKLEKNVIAQYLYAPGVLPNRGIKLMSNE